MCNSAIDNEWDGDVLSRKKYSVFLTKYLEDKSEACVININAPWGSGKTFFLQNWFEDIKKDHPAVYFNAWENDYSNDPLISIISSIHKGLTNLLPESAKNSHARKNFISKSGSMIKKLLPVVVKGGVSKLVGEEASEALMNTASDDKELISELSSKLAEELLSSNEAISSSIDEFKKSISSLINEVIEERRYLKPPLFIFIDELDRCRPLYSIELLERIKHIFDIPEVVFVVATDTQQLSHSVKAVYGEGFNGEIYLRRFFDQIYTLPEPNCVEFTTLLFKDFVPRANYFLYHINLQIENSVPYDKNYNVEENKNTLTCEQKGHAEQILLFSLFAKFFKLDLRTKKQCFDRFIAIEKSFLQEEQLHFAYLIFLIMLDAKHPTQFQRYFSCPTPNQISGEAIFNAFESVPDNLIIHNAKYTAKNLIEIYSRKVFLTKNELERLRYNLSRNADNFDSSLTISFYKNFDNILKYKEKVEMAGALS